MTAFDLALIGSLLMNVVLAWVWLTARAAAQHYRFGHDYMTTAYNNLRRNCVRRDPKTGRYLKDWPK